MTNSIFDFHPQQDSIKDIANSEELGISPDVKVEKWRQYGEHIVTVLIETFKLDINKFIELLNSDSKKVSHLLIPDADRDALNSFADTFDNATEDDWLIAIDEFALATLPKDLQGMLLESGASLIFDEKQWAHCLKLALTGQWDIQKRPILRVAYNALLLGWFFRLSTRHKKPNSRELHLYLKMDALLSMYCTSEFNSEVLTRVTRGLAKKKKNKRYKDSGEKRKQTTLEKKHGPILQFIKQKDSEGLLKDFAGEYPGVLATEINKLIIEENVHRKSRKKEQKKLPALYRYTAPQLKTILERYFSFKQGQLLPKPLKFTITEG